MLLYFFHVGTRRSRLTPCRWRAHNIRDSLAARTGDRRGEDTRAPTHIAYQHPAHGRRGNVAHARLAEGDRHRSHRAACQGGCSTKRLARYSPEWILISKCIESRREAATSILSISIENELIGWNLKGNRVYKESLFSKINSSNLYGNLSLPDPRPSTT